MNAIQEALSTVSHDALLQRVDAIAITYSTTDGIVHNFSYTDIDKSIYHLVGMIDDLKNDAYSLFDANVDKDDTE